MSAHEDIGSVSPSKPIAEPIAEPIADTTLIIVCGSGPLPTAVADAAIGRGRGVFLIAIDGWADRLAVARYPHAWIKLGQLGRVWRLMHQAGARDFVCVGGLVRPSVRSLRDPQSGVRSGWPISPVASRFFFVKIPVAVRVSGSITIEC